MEIKASQISVTIWLFLTVLSVSGDSSINENQPRSHQPTSLQDKNHGTLWNKSAENGGNTNLERNNSLTRSQKKKLKLERKQERKERREDRRRNRKRMKELNISLQQARPENSHSSLISDFDETANLQRNRAILVASTPKPTPHYFPDMTWLANNLTSIWQLLQQMQKDIKQIRRNNRAHRQSASRKEEAQALPDAQGVETTTEQCNPEWPVDPRSCLESLTATECGGKGRCVCGQCDCQTPYYGRFCQCNDHICEKYVGVMCGGAGKGQCRCGSCVCRPGYTGAACECSTSSSSCQSQDGGALCSGHGECICDRCQCTDGYTGKWCQDSIYSASVCERLKPCVLCQAFGRKYPQCEECKIVVELVDELELSQTTCVMINLGCIVKYAYTKSLPSDEFTKVFVPKGMSCPP